MKTSRKGSKLYVALVTPGSSAGVNYRHGVAWVSFFSCDMWVPLWETAVGSEQHIVFITYGLFSPTEHTDTT